MFVKKIILKNYPKKNYNRKINFALKNFLFIIGKIYKLVWIFKEMVTTPEIAGEFHYSLYVALNWMQLFFFVTF